MAPATETTIIRVTQAQATASIARAADQRNDALGELVLRDRRLLVVYTAAKHDRRISQRDYYLAKYDRRTARKPRVGRNSTRRRGHL